MLTHSNKRLMLQVFFFHNFLQNSLQKSFQFISLFFCNFTEIKIKSFECTKSIRNYEKRHCLEHQTLGQRVVCPINPAYHIEDWRIWEDKKYPHPVLLELRDYLIVRRSLFWGILIFQNSGINFDDFKQ